MTRQRYTGPAILFHWLQAGLIVWLLWLGWTMIDLPKGAERSATYGLHKSLGLCALLLVTLRLGWRQMRPAPALLTDGWEGRVAGATHVALYVCLVVAPVAGYLASAFTPYAVKFFGIELPKLAAPDEALNGLFKQVHVLAVWALAFLAALHGAAALGHGVRGDGTLSRMLPRRLSRN